MFCLHFVLHLITMKARVFLATIALLLVTDPVLGRKKRRKVRVVQ